MKGNRLFSLAVAVIAALATTAVGVRRAAAQTTGLKLWVDQRTGQVFVRPGPGRVPLAVTTEDANAMEQQIEQKVNARTDQEIRTQVQQSAAQLQEQNQVLAEQVNHMQPAWKSYMDNFQDKFRLGALFYGDYRFYTNTGFQPQELTQINNPGPGNNDYNSFDITRTYLNFFFFPTKDWELRLTPNMYRTYGNSNDKVGQTTGYGGSLDGNLGVRMKYASLTYSGLFDQVPMLKGDTIAVGEIPNPLVAWEEDLYGFRYVNLTPWNYLSLSSTQLGLSMEGPIKPFGGETTYADYGIGVYNNANFHQYEQSNLKQVMGRLSIYPFGQSWRFQGLGLTGFYNYGYGNTAPDSESIPTVLKGPNAHITRIAALLHYSAEQWGVAGEFDYGNNAFSAANMFSGSAPGDEYGFVTGTPVTTGTIAGNTCSTATPCYNPASGFGAQTAAWNALLNNGQSRQVGADFFGHFHIPGTNLTPFGMAE